MTQIFLSYSRTDKDIVNQLISQLEAAGHTVWIDREGIRGGEQWRQKIVEAIESGPIFLLVLSKNSVASDHVRAEIDVAKESRKHIIPVNLQPVEIPSTMKYQLAGLQRINLYPDYATGYQELLEALGGIDSAASASAPRPQKLTTAPTKWLWIGGAAALVVILVIIGALIASSLSPDGVEEPPAQAEITEPPQPEVVQQAQATSSPPQKIVPTSSAVQQVGQVPPPSGSVSQVGGGDPVQALPPQFDPSALTTIEELEPLLLQANIRLSEPEDLERTRTYFTGPDSAYHMLAIAALTVVGERRFIQPVNLDIVDKWYTRAAGSGDADRGPLDLELVAESLVDAHNDYYGDDTASLDDLLEPRY